MAEKNKRKQSRIKIPIARRDNTRVDIPIYDLRFNSPTKKVNPQVMRDVEDNDPSNYPTNAQVMSRTWSPIHNLDGDPQVMKEMPHKRPTIKRIHRKFAPASRFQNGRKIYKIGSLPWWGKEIKNLFRGIEENRKPSEYNPATQTFKGDEAELKGGSFGGSGGGASWSTSTRKSKPKKPLDIPIVDIQTETFNNAFTEARQQGKKTFWFNGKLYNTNLGGGPGTWEAGQRRKRIKNVNTYGVIPEP